LFLDELPEFQPQALDSLRQPLETGEAVIARVQHRITYPARFQLIAAMNPCRCGHATDPGFACRKAPNAVCMAQYQSRISGPFLDRIDLTIDVPAVTPSDLLSAQKSETSDSIARRVRVARQRQMHRYQAQGLGLETTNSTCPVSLLDQIAAPDEAGLALIRGAADHMNLTARGFHRVLKVSRTLADLDGTETIKRIHIAEALSYRTAPAHGAH
jgi:magnesium chelatase family protein